MSTMVSQITSLAIVCSIVYSVVDQRKHQSSASLAFVWGNHRWPMNSPHKWPVTRKRFPFDDVIMIIFRWSLSHRVHHTIKRHCMKLWHAADQVTCRWLNQWWLGSLTHKSPGIDGLTHWGRGKMAVISQTTLSSAFSWDKLSEFQLKFHWPLFPRVQLTIFQHCFRLWLGADQATSHYLKQWW